MLGSFQFGRDQPIAATPTLLGREYYDYGEYK
jgi:hypothetical protein